MTRLPLLCTGAALLAGAAALPQDKDEPVRLGTDEHRFQWVPNWLELPAGMELGNTHGCTVVDAEGRIYFNTDSEHAVVVVDADGKYLRSFGKELAGGLHGMCIRKEGEREFLYLSHLGRHEVIKTDLEGKLQWTLGYPAESGLYADAGSYKPTGVAVGPDGDIYVADGYGLSWVHQYDKDREYIRSFGGPGSEDGQMRTCHGIWLDTRGEAPTLVVADRENHRLQVFDLEGEHLATHTAELRRPCSVYQWKDELVVADLQGRITLLDDEFKVLAHMGDNEDPGRRANNGVPPADWVDGQFTAPHSVAFDAHGNIYVMDWNRFGRMSKLKRL
jgi:hypothetical protein